LQQGWCPVCRAKIESGTEKGTDNENKEDFDEEDQVSRSCSHPTAVAHLAEQFADAADNTETEDD